MSHVHAARESLGLLFLKETFSQLALLAAEVHFHKTHLGSRARVHFQVHINVHLILHLLIAILHLLIAVSVEVCLDCLQHDSLQQQVSGRLASYRQTKRSKGAHINVQ